MREEMEIVPAVPVRQRIVDILVDNSKSTGQEAVEYVLNLFEPRKKVEYNRDAVKRDTNKIIKTEIDPYADRVEYLLTKYFRLPEGHRKVIRDARAEEVFWRGDEIKDFKVIWNETLRMREMGVEAYRQESIQKMKDMIGGMYG